VAGHIEVIPNGAAVDGAVPARDVLEARVPELSGRRYVLFLGRIHAKKGLDLLMDAIAQPAIDAANVAVVVAGPVDREYAREWQQLLRRHPSGGRVIAPGAVEGELKAALLQHADLFVLPSYSEGLPVAVLEALAAGCAVVITRACNLPQVADAQAGLVIEPDAGELSRALRTLLTDEPRRRAMAANARALARREFDWDVIARRTLQLCRGIARGTAPG
jgi:glycosyltransferase involved in cell wall biosynthesis